MNKIRTYQFILALAIASLGLSGCGGSSNSTTPNSASKTIVDIDNGSKFDYASIAILNQDGNTVFSDQLNCASRAVNCFANVNEDINAGFTLLFKDANQRLVGAVVLANSASEYLGLTPSAMSTGFYLMLKLNTELASESQISWDNLNQRTLTFFTNYDSPDGTADPFEEIGKYYASQLAKGVKSEREFLDAFKLRLLNWDVAENSELPDQQSFSASFFERFWTLFDKSTFSFISSAHAQTNKCAPALKTFLSLAGNLGKVIPVVGEGVAGAGKMASSYCDGTGDQLKEIKTQLNQLQASVEKVAGSLSALSAFLFNEVANNKTADFQKLAGDADNLLTQYKSFLVRNGDVKSLQEFFVKAGGWDQGIQKGGKALAEILNYPYQSPRNIKGLYTSITETTSFADFDSYLSALKNRCDQLNTSSPENFLLTRQKCNNVILANSAMLVAAQGIALPIFQDIYATLQTYQTQAQNNYLLPNGLKSYASAHADAIQNFSTQQSNMIDRYKSAVGSIGFFDAFTGLNTSLIAALTSRQCNQSGTDRSNFPQIIGWYAPTSNDKQNYIETQCKVGNLADRVKARYYTGDQGSGVDANDVANVLGVPVAAYYVNPPTAGSSPPPLYFKTLDLANRTRVETLDRTSNPLYLEAPSINAAASFEHPINMRNDVISPNQSKSRNAFNNYEVPITSGSLSYWYVLIPSQSDYFRVARARIFNLSDSTNPNGYTSGGLECIAPPCRVDPTTDQWIIFTEDGGTLDLKPTTRSFNGRKIARLAPVGQ
jgi:hypothetical protein